MRVVRWVAIPLLMLAVFMFAVGLFFWRNMQTGEHPVPATMPSHVVQLDGGSGIRRGEFLYVAST
jgi:hypothetical protein